MNGSVTDFNGVIEHEEPDSKLENDMLGVNDELNVDHWMHAVMEKKAS